MKVKDPSKSTFYFQNLITSFDNKTVIKDVTKTQSFTEVISTV